MSKVNNMGVSNGAKQSKTVQVTGSSSSSSVNGKRKREEQAGKPSAAQHAHRRSMYEFGTLDQAAVAGLQPLRRTRSIARQIEQLGVPVSEAGGETSDSEREELHSLARNSDTESVERSIAEMSLDEISEHNDDAETGPDASDATENPEDSFYLEEASLAQLNRLRKDKLVQLIGLLNLEDNSDAEDCTKETLVKTIIETRSEQDPGAYRLRGQRTATASSEDEDDTIHTVTSSSFGSRASLRRKSGHSRGTSTASTSAPVSRSPRKSPRTRRSLNRSRSSTQVQPDSDAVTSDEDEDGPKRSPRARSHRSSVNLRSGSSAGLSRPEAVIERTPGRLRSGKLRNSISSVPSSSEADAGDDEEEDEEVLESASFQDNEDDMPTPIARRTRHGRNMSVASVSSAGMDDEDSILPNREYRLRKVSLPRQAKGKRNSIVELSDDDDSDEEEEAEAEADVLEEKDELTGETSALSDEDDDDMDELDHSVDFDLTDATESSLLKLRKDDLVKLCAVRDLATEGTKRQLAEELLKHQNQHQDDGGSSSSNSQSAVEDDDEDDEEDSSFQLDADTSMVSNESYDSDESAESTNTARASVIRARNETKTQALAKVSNKRQSCAPDTQKPLLLQKHSEHKHTPKIDTPPGSGDKQDNDLELDLESLNLLDKEIAPDKIRRGEKIGSGGFKDV